MNSTAKAHEPTMEEILASIRRIIADDDPASAEPAAKAKADVKAAEPAPKPAEAKKPSATAEEESAGLNQGDIDAMFASFDAPEPPKLAAAEAEEAEEPVEARKSLDEELAASWGAETEAEDEDDVLELTDIAAIGSSAAPSATREDKGDAGSFDADADLDDVAFTDPEPAAPLTAAARAAQAGGSRPGFSENLIAERTGEAVSAAFGSLSNTILSQNARTLDELVQDMLRPMLKEWLDDNLPQIVERLVRAEIERVSRGRR